MDFASSCSVQFAVEEESFVLIVRWKEKRGEEEEGIVRMV